MTIFDSKAQRLLRESEETALTLIEDRGETAALAYANHCAARTRDPFWVAVARAIEHFDDPGARVLRRRR